MTEGITLIPRMPWIAYINTAWQFWVIKSQLHELLPACYACFDSFKINMTTLYVCMDMHHMDTWSSEWSKDLRNPDHGKMESCDSHVTTGKCVHLHWRSARALYYSALSAAPCWLFMTNIYISSAFICPPVTVLHRQFFFYKMLLILRFMLG